MEKYSVIGKRLPRVDGVVKATGEAKYTVDMVLPRMLYGKILRSPYPHAKIVHIDPTKAERLQGVKAVITGKDTAGIKAMASFPGIKEDWTPLSMDRVRYIGDEVAAVAAIDEDIAEEALDLIEVEYEELPAVFDPEEAMRPDAPQIHEHDLRNISFQHSVHFGDVERGFKESDHIREDKFSTQAVDPAALETHAALASFDSSGNLTIWSSTQSPHILNHDLAKTLNMREGEIRVIKPYVGGGFGGKLEMFSHNFCAAFLSRKTGRPVKIVLTREEVFTATRHRHPMIDYLKTGVKNDGTLVASELRTIQDNGAYNGLHAPVILIVHFNYWFPLYLIKNIRFEGKLVYTNKSPGGAMRGFGHPQIRFAFETQLDMIAEDLGIDPVELRLKNAAEAGYVAPNMYKFDSCGLKECIQKAAKSANWKAKRKQRKDNHGLGIACTYYVSGAAGCGNLAHADSGAFVKIHEDGTVRLLTGASDIGQGSDTTLCQIVAEELGVRLEDVKIISADTGITPRDEGSFASRVTFTAGNAVKIAANDAKKQVLSVAAEMLEANVEDLEMRDRSIRVKGSPEKGVSFSEVVTEGFKFGKGMPVLGRGSYRLPIEYPDETGRGNISPAYSFSAHIAEVEVDRETGQVKVLSYYAAHDCGFAINPMAVEGQLEGSVIMGLGYALEEELLWDRGLALNPSLLKYKVPTALQTPEIKCIIVETIDPRGPFGAKETGEGTTCPVAPAIANAIYDAVGVRIKELPITPDKVLRALEEKEDKKGRR